MDDDLDRPLGRDRDEDDTSGLTRIGPRRVAFAIVALAATGVAALFVLAPQGPLDATLGGRPYALAKIEPLQPPPPLPAPKPPEVAKSQDAPPASSVQVRSAEEHAQAGTEVEYQNGVRVVRAGGGGAKPLIIEIEPGANPHLAPAPDKRLVEKSRFGLLPRIGADGARPMDVYARPYETRRLKVGAPRIALVVGGLGLNPQSTEAAIAELPENVTLAFAPYGPTVADDAAKARARGHEILLQAPMEPFNYPQNDPGPHTLRVEAGDMKEDLHWLMSRFTGYVGLMSFLGSRFTANEQAFAPALEEIARRGLFIVDDGGSPQSLIPATAAKVSAPAARVDIVLDSRGTPQSL
ncbi:MAG: divergent polysaccharide deacetylase family protein, partial [Methylocystis sp.]